MIEKSQQVLLKINRDLIEMQRIQQVKDVRGGGRIGGKLKSKHRITNRRRSKFGCFI
jgi:hypothetical protein